MSLNFINNEKSKWMEGNGPEKDIVISSRVRLARNFANFPFPHMLNREQGHTIIQRTYEGIKDVFKEEIQLILMDDLDQLNGQILVEKHLISPNLAASQKGGVILNKDHSISIMINEEDHIRIQCLYPGLQLEKAFDMCNKLDDLLEESIDYAYTEEYGYLTVCPTNVGTGMRASVMLHLPALALANRLNKVFSALAHVGLVVRGLFGEGTESMGNIYQVSNQITLGLSEEEIIENLKSVTMQIIEHERAARRALLKETEINLKDKVLRAKGILSTAHIISTVEAMELLSYLRLGIDLNIINDIPDNIFNEMIVMIQPAYLQKSQGTQLSTVERDVVRASLIREKIINKG